MKGTSDVYGPAEVTFVDYNQVSKRLCIMNLPYNNTRGSFTSRIATLNCNCAFISLSLLGTGRAAILANKAEE